MSGDHEDGALVLVLRQILKALERIERRQKRGLHELDEIEEAVKPKTFPGTAAIKVTRLP